MGQLNYTSTVVADIPVAKHQKQRNDVKILSNVVVVPAKSKPNSSKKKVSEQKNATEDFKDKKAFAMTATKRKPPPINTTKSLEQFDNSTPGIRKSRRSKKIRQLRC